MNKIRGELHGPEKWFIRKESSFKNDLTEENDEELVSNSIIKAIRSRFRSEKDETELDLFTVDLALMQEGPTSDVLWPKGFDDKKGWIQSKLVGAWTKRN